MATATVTVVPAFLYISNVFTPNGDGRNDYFEIGGIEGFDRVEVTVINRWGQEVYHNVEYRNDWDGANLREGTFYYQIRTFAGRQSTTHSGWVLLKRH